MFFVVRSNDSFNFPLGWIKYIVVVNKTGGAALNIFQLVDVSLLVWISDHSTVFKNRPNQGQVGCSSAFFWTGPQVSSQQANAGVRVFGDGAEVLGPRQILREINSKVGD